MSSAFVNNVKTVLLLGALMGLVVGVGATLGGTSAILPALFIAIVMNFGAFFFSSKIAISAMRGQEVTGGKLYEMVDDLRQRAGLPMPKVYVCQAAAPSTPRWR